ncbi:MAG: class I SAM-dependent methyltransferase [Magnetovibrionaceae bacterium]
MEASLFDQHAQLEDRHWWFTARRSILSDIVARLVAGIRTPKVLDVGCGTGGMTAWIGRRWSCTGLDVSEQAISRARLLYPEADFIQGRMPESVEHLAGEADVFMLLDVLEHIEDDRAFLADLVAIMPTGSRLLITVPADPALWSEHDVTAGHVRRYVGSELSALFQGLPLRCDLQTPFNSLLYPIIKFIRQRGWKVGQDGSDFSLPSPPVNGTLRMLFAAEGFFIRRGLKTGRPAFPAGVSLLAVLTRLPDQAEASS